MKQVTSKLFFVLFTIMSYNSFSQTANLSSQEIKDMKYMLEEEKVARDVYELLDKKWNLRVFNNIKQSEQRHMDMMENLLNSNKISYQFSDKRGVFYNKELQKLYNDLTEKGLKSKYDALEVGKTIEVTDIYDLEKAKKLTTNSQIKDVYSKLIFASNNHLRAFSRNLSKFQNQ
ncbi:DUF2202 domain-containing protein [Yeosuana marina]|uniref:DUF2202 domain-containing protein n=1 Tax=Yeosuana marina TaxID=1565536 RepID=UPI0030EE699B|tara:strand:+ start:1086 stop:1607 length:522 start_codon:yes stop_codon:yes gene_type:complete